MGKQGHDVRSNSTFKLVSYNSKLCREDSRLLKSNQDYLQEARKHYGSQQTKEDSNLQR